MCVDTAWAPFELTYKQVFTHDVFVRIVVTELGPVSEKFMSSNTSTNDRPHEDLDFERCCCRKTMQDRNLRQKSSDFRSQSCLCSRFLPILSSPKRSRSKSSESTDWTRRAGSRGSVQATAPSATGGAAATQHRSLAQSLPTAKSEGCPVETHWCGQRKTMENLYGIGDRIMLGSVLMSGLFILF